MNLIVPNAVLLREATLAEMSSGSAIAPSFAFAPSGLLDAVRNSPADAGLLALGEVWAASWARCVTADAMPGDDDEAEQERGDAHEENSALRTLIMAQPARTLDGLKLKARIAREMLSASEPWLSPIDALAAYVEREHRDCTSVDAIAPNLLRDLLMLAELEE